MKCLSWTSPLMLSKNVYSSLCSTFFTSNFFGALEGRNLSNSTIAQVSEVNVKFVTTWLKQWERNNGRKSVSCVVYCKKPFIQRPYKEKPTMKGKADHEKKNCTGCQSFSLTPADTILTWCYVKKMVLNSKKLVREYKFNEKHGITCTSTLMQTRKNMTFHPCIVHVQVLICYVNTRLQRIFKRFC